MAQQPFLFFFMLGWTEMGPSHYLYDHWLHPATMSTVWPLHVKSCNDHHPRVRGGWEKEEGGLFGRRRKGVSGVLGGARKFSMWLVAGGGNGGKGKGERGGREGRRKKLGKKLGTNLGPCFSQEGSQPLAQICHHGLSK